MAALAAIIAAVQLAGLKDDGDEVRHYVSTHALRVEIDREEISN